MCPCVKGNVVARVPQSASRYIYGLLDTRPTNKLTKITIIRVRHHRKEVRLNEIFIHIARFLSSSFAKEVCEVKEKKFFFLHF